MTTRRTRHLIEAQIPALRRFARALLRDAEAADDLVQDCLLRALSRWHLLRSDEELRAWLFAMLRNLHIDALRAKARRGTAVALDLAPEPAAAGTPEGALHFTEVMAALDRLPLEQREVLLLVGVEDFSYEATARILGIPRGTVMSRLSRGRAALRALTEDPPTETERTGPRPTLRSVK